MSKYLVAALFVGTFSSMQALGARVYNEKDIHYEDLTPTLESNPRCPAIEFNAGVVKQEGKLYVLSLVSQRWLRSAISSYNSNSNSNSKPSIFLFETTPDGYLLSFNPDVEHTQIGYVDVHWSLRKFNDAANTPPTEYEFRMKKESRDVFTNELRFSDVEDKIKLNSGDILRYFFRYWAVPKNSQDSGFLCTSPVKWFASPVVARNDEL